MKKFFKSIWFAIRAIVFILVAASRTLVLFPFNVTVAIVGYIGTAKINRNVMEKAGRILRVTCLYPLWYEMHYLVPEVEKYNGLHKEELLKI